MRLVKPSFEIWEQSDCLLPNDTPSQDSLLLAMYRHIERCGRVCYKSEDKITETSALDFVSRMKVSNHLAMLEHGTVYLKVACNEYPTREDFMDTYGSNPYTKYDDSECDWYRGKGNIYITTNLRVLVENNWLQDLDCLCAPTELHPKRVSVHITTNRTVTHELVRHRVMSFAQESTRYCNYTKDKFGGKLTFIRPIWLEENPNEPKLLEDPQYLEAKRWLFGCFEDIEFTYAKLLQYGWKPQQAAILLPSDIKSEIVVTGFLDDWEHLFGLRVKGTTGAPHPQMVEIMEPVYKAFIERGWLTNDHTA